MRHELILIDSLGLVMLSFTADVAPAQECALKVFGPAGLVDYEHEVMCLQTVHSCRIPHTIEYVDHLEDPDIGPFIVTRPYCQTSLERVLEAWTEAGTTDKPLLPYDSLLWISANLAQALVELHEVRPIKKTPVGSV